MTNSLGHYKVRMGKNDVIIIEKNLSKYTYSTFLPILMGVVGGRTVQTSVFEKNKTKKLPS